MRLQEEVFESVQNSAETIWSGNYSTWGEAVSAAEELNSAALDPVAFDSQRWLQRQRGILLDTRNGLSPRYSTLPLLAAGLGPHTIVDFGGGSGWAYELLTSSTKFALSKYIVIEREATIAAFSREFRADSNVEFIPISRVVAVKTSGSKTVLYSNSTLQYEPENKSFLGLVECLQPKMILFDDFQSSVGAEFFSLQHYYGAEIPCRFPCVQDLRRDLLQCGYKVLGAWHFPKTFAGMLVPRVSSTQEGPCLAVDPQTLLFVRDLEFG